MSEQIATLTQEELEQHKAEFFARGGKITVLDPQYSARELRFFKPARATSKDSALSKNSNSDGIGA